jgi:hypothetical protein
MAALPAPLGKGKLVRVLTADFEENKVVRREILKKGGVKGDGTLWTFSLGPERLFEICVEGDYYMRTYGADLRHPLCSWRICYGAYALAVSRTTGNVVALVRVAGRFSPEIMVYTGDGTVIKAWKGPECISETFLPTIEIDAETDEIHVHVPVEVSGGGLIDQIYVYH